jgi:hypothetical protein
MPAERTQRRARLRCRRRADTDRRSEELVRLLQACGEVHGIAMGSVVEFPAGAHLSKHSRTGLDTDPGSAEAMSGKLRALAHFFGQVADRYGASDRLVDMVGEILGRIEEGMDGVANDLVDHAAIPRDAFTSAK